MSMQVSERELQQLRSLYELREKQALEAISEQRLEVERVLRLLAEQQQLICGLSDELIELHNMRSTTSIQDMTAQSLQAESARRRWLTYDLEQEKFYLPGFNSDVADARRELAVRQRAWVRTRDRIKSLDQQALKIEAGHRLIQARKEDALLDDRRTTPGASLHG
ncbi:hypothetical protein [Granulosicoccus antarcticus]|uniref:Flagellar FliJ protein n=1 Tax=Granulosicoccus antarcticus IMCC3135 TaxID=1192854 RepID=A0A2Z2NGU1_9GAMM|nr:hypothetical protein [Granulosicoccus antarcticus]ASJ70506.1 hypothetical protein IMCC3135_01960 [Granulosicoccus antarcticus IMCC3135]